MPNDRFSINNYESNSTDNYDSNIMDKCPILECRNLVKKFSNKDALKGIDLKINPGRIVGLLGPNGSGKSTLIKLANALLTPTSGEILINGKGSAYSCYEPWS